jgi:hypothetical protein
MQKPARDSGFDADASPRNDEKKTAIAARLTVLVFRAVTPFEQIFPICPPRAARLRKAYGCRLLRGLLQCPIVADL